MSYFFSLATLLATLLAALLLTQFINEQCADSYAEPPL